jgi:hypothetical protein
VDCGVPLTAVVTRDVAKELGVERGGAECVVSYRPSALRLH